MPAVKDSKASPTKDTKAKEKKPPKQSRKGGKPKKEDLKSSGGGKKETQRGGAGRGLSQSCHQCRQSIHSSKGVSEVKSGKERLKCSQCTRYW